VEYWAKPALDVWAHARQESGVRPGDSVTGDVTLVDGEGNVLVHVVGLEARRLSPPEELHDWLYTLRWMEANETGPHLAPQSTGTWLIFADSGGAGEAVRSFLEARGQVCVTVRPGAEYRQIAAGSYQIDPGDASGFRHLLRDGVKKPLPCHGVIFLWALDSDGIPDSSHGPTATFESLAAARDLGCGSVLHLVQALAQTGWRDAPRLCLVTREATTCAIAQAPLWGFARTLALEHPEFRCTRIDLSAASGSEELAWLCETCWFEDSEQEIAWRAGARHVSRLVRGRLQMSSPVRIRPDGAYLLTGAFGGMGLTVARWLVARGARHLVMTGIREPSESARQVIDDLRVAGSIVTTACADVAQHEELERVFQKIDGEALRLRGVFHCAGVLDDGILLKLTTDRLNRVLEPKQAGAWNLHVLTCNRKLDYFVLFSSASALLGSPGQANYTAANAFLDQLAHYRHSLRLPALSVNWGPWAEVGLAAAQANRGQRLALQGIGSLTPEQGIRALESLLGQTAPQMAVVPFDLRQWREFYPALAGAALFAELIDEAGGRGGSSSSGPRMSELLREAEAGERRGLLENHIREVIAGVMRLDPSRIPVQTSLGNLGLDSLMGLEIRNRLERSLGLTLPATLAWTYPTIAALTIYFEDALNFTGDARQTAHAAVAAAAVAGDDFVEIENLSEEDADRMLQHELAVLDRDVRKDG
jgi:acyl carrier protein